VNRISRHLSFANVVSVRCGNPDGPRAVEMSCHGPGGGDAPRIFFPTLTTVVLGTG
jgi:hypothetical protein